MADGALYCLCFFILTIYAPGSSRAELVIPFQTRDQNPLLLGYGLPHPGTPQLLEKGRQRVYISSNVSNTLIDQRKDNEQLLVDGETFNLNLIWEYGFKDDWNIRLTLPFISHAGGGLDHFIEEFHATFNFPNGERSNHPQNRLLFLYQRDGDEKLRLDQSGSGVGDISVAVAKQLAQDSNHAVSLWTSLKLPTGDAEALTGSGSTDFAVWLSAAYPLQDNWQLYYGGGLLWMSQGEILPSQQKSFVGFGSFGIEWRPMPKRFSGFRLKMQADAHSAFFRGSQLKFLNESIQLVSGGSINLSRNLVLELGVGEDILVNASPDVNFYITLRRSF